MLPAFRRISISAVVTLGVALGVALPSTPAQAFDAREQGVITGVLGTLLITGLIAENNKHRAPNVVQPPVYQTPVYQPPVYQPRISVNRTPAALAYGTYAPSERRLIQRRLSRLGYYYGAIDGAFGPGTYTAVLAYARDQGSAVNSRNAAFSVYDSLIF